MFDTVCFLSLISTWKDFYCFFDPFLFPSIEEKYFLAYGEDFIKQWILGEIYWVVVEIPHQEAVEYFPFQNKALAMEFCYEYKTATSFLGETAKMGAINDSAERVTNLVFEKLDTHYYTKLSNFYDDGKLERWHVLQTELKE